MSGVQLEALNNAEELVKVDVGGGLSSCYTEHVLPQLRQLRHASSCSSAQTVRTGDTVQLLQWQWHHGHAGVGGRGQQSVVQGQQRLIHLVTQTWSVVTS